MSAPPHSSHSKPLSSFQRAAIFQEQTPCHKAALFAATVSRKKEAHFSQGQMLNAGTCSLNHPLVYSTWDSLYS